MNDKAILRGAVFVGVSALYGFVSYIVLAAFVVWAIGDGPSSRPYSGDLFWVLVVFLILGFVACQFVALKAVNRKRQA